MAFDEDLFPLMVALVMIVLTIVFVSTKRKDVPTVFDLKIYPIKSCAPITLDEACATETGFKYDRMAQVSSEGSYCTPRDKKYAKLFHIKPSIEKNVLSLASPEEENNVLTVDLDSPNPKTKPVQAVPMIGPKVKLQDYGDEVAKWLEKAVGCKGVRLTGIGEGYKRIVEVNPDQNEALPPTKEAYPVSLADEAPYLLTSTSSLFDLNRKLKKRGKGTIPMQRFRPNIVLDGLKPWEEDSFSRIRIGSVEFHVWQRCGRCAMTTIDRDSLGRGPEPLATMNEFRERSGQRNFGMHLIPVASTCGADGTIIRVGDKVEILEYDEERKAEWERLFG